jgi:alpha-galactosidase
MVQEGVLSTSRPSNLRFPGLDPAAQYEIREVQPAGASRLWQIGTTPWMENGVQLSGAALSEVGLVAPILTSEQAILVEIAKL